MLFDLCLNQEKYLQVSLAIITNVLFKSLGQ